MVVSDKFQKIKTDLEDFEHKLKSSALTAPNTLYIFGFIIYYIHKMMMTTIRLSDST